MSLCIWETRSQRGQGAGQGHCSEEAGRGLDQALKGIRLRLDLQAPPFWKGGGRASSGGGAAAQGRPEQREAELRWAAGLGNQCGGSQPRWASHAAERASASHGAKLRRDFILVECARGRIGSWHPACQAPKAPSTGQQRLCPARRPASPKACFQLPIPRRLWVALAETAGKGCSLGRPRGSGLGVPLAPGVPPAASSP